MNRLLSIVGAPLALAAFLTPPAAGQVVRSGPVDITIPRDFTGLRLDVVTGQATRIPSDDDADFAIIVISDEWTFANLDRLRGGGIIAESAGGPPALLVPGEAIGPGSPVRTGGGIRSGGRFDDVQDAYLGFFFENEATGTLHYGWAEITLPGVDDGRITAYAYEATPMTAIVVGDAAACRADFDGDGALTVFDFLDFQNLFAAGDLRADFDGDGALTLFDFLDFQSAFDAGCP